MLPRCVTLQQTQRRLVEKEMKGKLKLKFGTPHDFIMGLF